MSLHCAHVVYAWLLVCLWPLTGNFGFKHVVHVDLLWNHLFNWPNYILNGMYMEA